MLLKLVMKLGGGSDKWKTENKDAKGHIDLFRIDEDDISHYVCMTDCSRLSNSQKSEFHKIGLTFVNVAIIVLELRKVERHHEKGCMEVEGQQVEMPTPDEELKLKLKTSL